MSTLARGYKTGAVVLRARVYGEADRILTLFTTLRGKLDAIAKGVRRTKSHLGGRLEIGNEVLLTMHRGRSLDVIVSAEIETAHWEKIVRPDRFAAASLVLESIDAFCEPDLPLSEVYLLLTRALGAIARSQEPLSLIPRFWVQLLGVLGLFPPTGTCIRCGAELLESAWLDMEQGGFAGPECAAAWREALSLDENDLANLRALAAPARGAVKAQMRATERVAQAMEDLIGYHLGRRPRSGLPAAELVRDR